MKLHYFASIVLMLVIFFFLVAKAGAQDVTVTVDGVAVDVQSVVVNIQTVTEPPVEPPIDPPIEPPIEPPVEPPIDPPANCGAVPPNGVGQSWLSLFQTAFPGPRNKQVVVSIPRNGGYRAVVFQTGNVSDSGAVRNFEAPGSTGSRLIAISECPGKFDGVGVNCKTLVGTYQESIIWSTRNLAGYCNLKQNTTYYWNTKFYNPCTSQYCNTTLRVSNSDYR